MAEELNATENIVTDFEASEKAVFAHPGANLGIIIGWGWARRLSRSLAKPALWSSS